jgi:hypothetical protein
MVGEDKNREAHHSIVNRSDGWPNLGLRRTGTRRPDELAQFVTASDEVLF